MRISDPPDCCTVTDPPKSTVVTGALDGGGVGAATVVGEDAGGEDAGDEDAGTVTVEVVAAVSIGAEVAGVSVTQSMVVVVDEPPADTGVTGSGAAEGAEATTRSWADTGIAGRSETSPPTLLTAASVIDAVPRVASTQTTITPIRFHMHAIVVGPGQCHTQENLKGPL